MGLPVVDRSEEQMTRDASAFLRRRGHLVIEPGASGTAVMRVELEKLGAVVVFPGEFNADLEAFGYSVPVPVMPRLGWCGIKHLMRAASLIFEVTIHEIQARGHKKRNVADARSAIVVIARDVGGMTWHQIAHHLKRGEHTTGISAYKRGKRLISERGEFALKFEKLHGES